MGGHAAGEVASALAAEVIRRVYYDRDGPVPQVLAQAFMEAHRTIVEYAEQHPECKGMGTTCTVLAFRDRHAWLAHIGDSRAYLLRERELIQLSEDQTLVAKLVSEGTMTQQEADHSPMHNVILQALGAQQKIAPMIGARGLPLHSGDVLILCSDGVSNLVPNDKIAEIAARLPPQEACDALIEAALAAGGDDNASLGIFSVTDAVESTRASEPTTRRIKIPIERDMKAEVASVSAHPASQTPPPR
jgi:protein phosphatase